jgi:ligand-binding sensor domain-containing protein/AraC-like DNA-binding protein
MAIMLLTFITTWAAESMRRFETIAGEGDANTIYSILPDNRGMVWFGTNQGLYLFDGYSLHRRYTPGSRQNAHIYCGVEYNGRYYLGGNNGLLVYDMDSDKYLELHTIFPHEVRAMALDGKGNLLIGSLGGLYLYDIAHDSLKPIKQGLPHNAVYAIANNPRQPQSFFIGTYNGLALLDTRTLSLTPISINCNRQRYPNLFVNSLLYDKHRNLLWIGTEGELYRLDTSRANTTAHAVAALHGNSIKSLGIDSAANIIIGTDNGLYVYDGDNDNAQQYTHDSRDPASLSNNVVWSVYVDPTDNVWAGTEYNLSFSASGTTQCETFTLSQLTGRGDGNRIYEIYIDSEQNLWLGGTNGLIRHSLRDNSSTWYKPGDAKHPLPHNRIRSINRDSHGDIWIATDGSINRYDSDNDRFVPYIITDSSRTYNANWAYATLDDGRGHLYVGSYLGGVLVSDLAKLRASQGTYIAERTYNSTNGLPCNYVNQLVLDTHGNIWVALYQTAKIARISPNGKVTQVDIQQSTGYSPGKIVISPDGTIRCTSGSALVDIDSNTGRVTATNTIPTHRPTNILATATVGNEIWLSTSNGVWAFDTAHSQFSLLPLPSGTYTAIYHDTASQQIYLGEVDRVLRVPASISTISDTDSQIVLSEVLVNDMPYRPDNLAPQLIKRLSLAHDQNRVQIFFSDLAYAGTTYRRQYEYSLNPEQDDWTALEGDENCITLANLSPGNYTLRIRPIGSHTNGHVVATIPIHISRPWYASTPAIIIYMLLTVGLVVWIIIFMHIRQRLRLERIQRDQVLESVHKRIDHLTDISRQLRMPLSNILNISEQDMDNPHMQGIHANATDINNMISQTLDIPVPNKTSTKQPTQRQETYTQPEQKLTADQTDHQADTEDTQHISTAPVPSPAEERLLAALLQLINNELDNPDLNVSHVCDRLHTNSKQLYRVVKKHLATTPVELIKQHRLERAATLLKQHRFTVSEVMYMVGFNSPGYFSKCFASRYGVTPRAYAETSATTQQQNKV